MTDGKAQLLRSELRESIRQTDGKQADYSGRRPCGLLCQQLHFIAVFFKTIVYRLFAQLKQRKSVGCLVHYHQCALLGKPFYLDIERLFTDAPVCQHAVIEKDGDGIAGKAFTKVML